MQRRADRASARCIGYAYSMAALTLEIVEGPDAGRQIGLGGVVVLGRTEASDVVLADEQVSRRHLRIEATDTGARIEDLGSRNGSFVNGHPAYGPTVIRPGDQLLIGVTLLQLRHTADIATRGSGVRPVPPGLATAKRQPTYVSPSPIAPLISELDPLLDPRVKAKAATAPIAIFAVATIAVLIFLAARGGL